MDVQENSGVLDELRLKRFGMIYIYDKYVDIFILALDSRETGGVPETAARQAWNSFCSSLRAWNQKLRYKMDK